MFWRDFFDELGRIAAWLAVIAMVATVAWLLLRRARRASFHCARCKKTLRYPECCPHISEAGWAMIKNSVPWDGRLPK